MVILAISSKRQSSLTELFARLQTKAGLLCRGRFTFFVNPVSFQPPSPREWTSASCFQLLFGERAEERAQGFSLQ